jgi:hypothetical protein
VCLLGVEHCCSKTEGIPLSLAPIPPSTSFTPSTLLHPLTLFPHLFSFAHHTTRQSEDHLVIASTPFSLPHFHTLISCVALPPDSSQQQSFTVSSPSSINNTNHQGSRNCHSPQLTTSHPVHLSLQLRLYSLSHLSEAISHYQTSQTNQTTNNKSSPYSTSKSDNVCVFTRMTDKILLASNTLVTSVAFFDCSQVVFAFSRTKNNAKQHKKNQSTPKQHKSSTKT